MYRIPILVKLAISGGIIPVNPFDIKSLTTNITKGEGEKGLSSLSAEDMRGRSRVQAGELSELSNDIGDRPFHAITLESPVKRHGRGNKGERRRVGEEEGQGVELCEEANSVRY